jgi:hypothetical protein
MKMNWTKGLFRISIVWCCIVVVATMVVEQRNRPADIAIQRNIIQQKEPYHDDLLSRVGVTNWNLQAALMTNTAWCKQKAGIAEDKYEYTFGSGIEDIKDVKVEGVTYPFTQLGDRTWCAQRYAEAQERLRDIQAARMRMEELTSIRGIAADVGSAILLRLSLWALVPAIAFLAVVLVMRWIIRGFGSIGEGKACVDAISRWIHSRTRPFGALRFATFVAALLFLLLFTFATPKVYTIRMNDGSHKNLTLVMPLFHKVSVDGVFLSGFAVSILLAELLGSAAVGFVLWAVTSAVRRQEDTQISTKTSGTTIPPPTRP